MGSLRRPRSVRLRPRGPSSVGLAGLVRLLPAGAIAPFAASIGDRVRRERLLLAFLVLEALALIGSGLAAFVDDRLTVFVLAAVVGATSTLVRPAVQSILPSVARTTTELVASNGATATFEGLGALGGPLVVGTTIVFVGAGGVFVASGVTLVVAIAILAGVHVPPRVELGGADSRRRDRVGAARRPRPPGAPRRLPGPVRTAIGGIDHVTHDPQLRLLIGLTAAQCFVRGCLNVLVVIAAFNLFHAGSSGVGYLNAALGVGGLLGAFVGTSLETKRMARSFGVAIAFWGAPIALLAPLSWLGPAMLCLVAVGVANGVEDVGLVTLLQRACPYEMLSSVLGVLWGLAMAAVALGSIVAPKIDAGVGARTALVIVGVILPALALAFSRRLRRVDAMLRPTEGLDLVEAVPMFGPLSVAVKERLASSLTALCVAAGETIIRVGEPGDRFYIVRAGRLVIERDGIQVAQAERGDYFGEVALVQDVPRNATVRAVVRSELYALGRQAFVTAIVGHPAAAAAAQRVAAERGTGPAPRQAEPGME